jgi:hypothetical protein
MLALAIAPPLLAQAPLPPPFVLVLKRISETHVRPVTGIVIASDGRVLVPASFVSRGDEIVALDGGTDIVRHGRATRTLARSAEQGLALLAADGLARPAMVLSLDEPVDETLRFAAFPPANDLAEGAPPLQETLRQSLVDGEATISADTPPPNLDGALLDGCGYLAGLVLANGEPGLQRDAQPRVLLRPRLAEVLAELGVQPLARACRSALPAAATGEPHTAPDEDPGGAPLMLDPGTLLPATPDLAIEGHAAGNEEALRVEVESPPATRPDPASDDAPSGPAPPLQQPHQTAAGAADLSAGESASEPPTPTNWLLILPLAAAAGVAGWVAGRRHKPHAKGPGDATASPSPTELAERGAPDGGGAGPERTDLGFKVRLSFPDGRVEQGDLELAAGGSGLLLGRGQADLVVDHPSVGRLQARLKLIGGQPAMTDLGSGSGTWVAGAACLEGETFYLPDPAEIQLGRVLLELSRRDRQAAGAPG